MSLDLEPALYDARAALWYAHPSGVSTFSACSRKGCTNSARGGRICSAHAEADLAAVVGEELAKEYADTIKKLRQIESSQIDFIKGRESAGT